jgi:hypothetical protein
MNDKIDKLLRLRMEIDNISFDAALDDTLLRGFCNYHPYFNHFIIDDTYEEISFDAETRTISLVDNDEKSKECFEEEMIKWKRPVHYRASN